MMGLMPRALNPGLIGKTLRLGSSAGATIGYFS